VQTTLVCNQPLRPTQPPTLSRMGNEYQPKCDDAVRVGSKDRHGMAHSICGCTCGWQVKLSDTSLAHAIPEWVSGELLSIRHYTIKSVLFTLLTWTHEHF